VRYIGLPAKTALIVLALLVTSVIARIAPRVVAAATRAGTTAAAVSAPVPQQFPIMNRIADRIVQKYQTSSCEQLWQERAEGKNKPKSQEEQNAIAILRSNTPMRQAFIGKVAAPIADKMVECGMIP
jgi:hypothetical protein